MKKLNTLILGVLALTLTTLNSCKKEGCIDADATNYNIDAKKDDGTCTYEGNVVFWYGQTVANNLIADGASSLTFYVDGIIVGSSSASVYWTSAPTFGENSSVTVTKNLGGVNTQSYSYSVEDQTGWEYWSGTLNFNANSCTTIELTW